MAAGVAAPSRAGRRGRRRGRPPVGEVGEGAAGDTVLLRLPRLGSHVAVLRDASAATQVAHTRVLRTRNGPGPERGRGAERALGGRPDGRDRRPGARERRSPARAPPPGGLSSRRRHRSARRGRPRQRTATPISTAGDPLIPARGLAAIRGAVLMSVDSRAAGRRSRDSGSTTRETRLLLLRMIARHVRRDGFGPRCPPRASRRVRPAR